MAQPSKFNILARVKLGSRHFQSGKTEHWIVDEKGKRPFPPFVSLSIVQYEGDADYYLLHECEDHFGTDTCHESFEGALHQAEFEFGVTSEEWSRSLE